jgi:putative membrane protein
MTHPLAALGFDPWDHMGGWNWAGMTLMMLILVALVAGFIWAAARPGAGDRQSTPLQILEERYARGEIDEEELRRRRQTLQGGSPR